MTKSSWQYVTCNKSDKRLLVRENCWKSIHLGMVGLVKACLWGTNRKWTEHNLGLVDCFDHIIGEFDWYT